LAGCVLTLEDTGLRWRCESQEEKSADFVWIKSSSSITKMFRACAGIYPTAAKYCRAAQLELVPAISERLPGL
jgi:hypothetical protein